MATPAGRGFADAGETLGGARPDGKEAATVGKAILVVALAGAAFAGGAVFNNGPALAKVQALIQGSPAKPGASASTPPAQPADDAPSPGGEPATDIPATPSPALALVAPGGLEPPTLPPPRRPAALKTDAELVKADGDPSASASTPEAEPEPLDAKALVLDAKAAKAEPPPKPRAEPAEAPNPAGWDGLRRRMKALGVARYWCEGEPGGPARFRCVIPTAGGRAVSQHFEAEGDDDLQAAEAALRRVALWKATEQP